MRGPLSAPAVSARRLHGLQVCRHIYAVAFSHTTKMIILFFKAQHAPDWLAPRSACCLPRTAEGPSATITDSMSSAPLPEWHSYLCVVQISCSSPFYIVHCASSSFRLGRLAALRRFRAIVLSQPALSWNHCSIASHRPCLSPFLLDLLFLLTSSSALGHREHSIRRLRCDSLPVHSLSTTARRTPTASNRIRHGRGRQ